MLSMLACSRRRVRWIGTYGQGFDLGDEWRQIILLAAGKNEVCPGPSQRAAEVLAEAATGSGDERKLPGEIEEFSALMPRSPASFGDRGRSSSGSVRGSAGAANHEGPSASGATAVMSGATLILPSAISSMAWDTRLRKRRNPAGESAARQLSAAADLPGARCCRRARRCRPCARSRSQCDMFRRGRLLQAQHLRHDLSVMLHDLCGQIRARGLRKVCRRHTERRASDGLRRHPRQRRASIARARAACSKSRPIIPAPMTSAVSPPFISETERRAMQQRRLRASRHREREAYRADDRPRARGRLGTRRMHRRGGIRRRRRQLPGDRCRGSPRHARQNSQIPAEDRGVEGDAVTQGGSRWHPTPTEPPRRQRPHDPSRSAECAARKMPSYPWTSLPQMPQAATG
jgi:hypothetical protein